MAEATLSSEFYWNNIVVKVEDTFFCVPQCEFVNSSHVFADMFLLPSGPTRSEGQDRDHPIVLQGYRKDEFASLLRVMYPRAGCLISGTNLELRLEKEEWVSVLKLSTIWDMKKIRQYAIHRLSTDVTLSPIEKMLLARAHRVSPWLIEAITSLAGDIPKPTLEELVTLGWETAARILWIRDNANTSNNLCFKRDTIKCGHCLSSSSLINSNYGCGHIASASAELTFSGPGSPTSAGTANRLVALRLIQCKTCGSAPFSSISNIYCGSCMNTSSSFSTVRVTPTKALKELIEEMFGEEIKDYDLCSMPVV